MPTLAYFVMVGLDHGGYPPQEVLAFCDGFKVFGIHTGRHATKMVEDKAIRDNPKCPFIAQAMGKPCALPSPAKTERSISRR